MKATYHAIPRSEHLRVMRLVSKMADLPEDAVRSGNSPTQRMWRRLAMAVFSRAGYSSTQIGTAFGFDHSTVLAGVKRIEREDSVLVDTMVGVAGVPNVSLMATGVQTAEALARVQAVADEVAIDAGERSIDRTIARLDRALSEIMLQVKTTQDAADTATLRHHAGDLILSGVAILRRLGRLGDLAEYRLQERA